VLAASGAACSEPDAQPLRRVVPLLGMAAFDARSAVLDEQPNAVLARGERTTRAVQVQPGIAYTLAVDYEGARPHFFGAAATDAQFEPLHGVPGRESRGRAEAVFYPEQRESLVEVRAAEGELRLLRVVLRPWGDERGAAFASGAPRELEGLEVFGDHRLGHRIRPGERWELTSTVPDNATRLVFDMAPDPTVPINEPVTPGLGLALRIVADGEEHAVLERAVADQRAAWETVDLDVRSYAGRTVTVVWECTLLATGDPVAPDAPGLAVAVPEWSCETGRRRPNLILLSLDTTRPDHLGFHGYPRATSPELDELAARSVVFEQARSTAPYTLPSHASLFSGQYPTTHAAEHPAHALDIERTPLLAAVLPPSPAAAT
jgi:hypothetical protein